MTLSLSEYFKQGTKLLIEGKWLIIPFILKFGNYTYGKTRDRLGDLRVWKQASGYKIYL